MPPLPQRATSIRNAYQGKGTFKTPKLSDLVKVEAREQTAQSAEKVNSEPDKPYTDQELKAAWDAFAETRKIYQAEYHLLSQPFTRNNGQIIITLHNPVEEALLGHFKSDLAAWLREKLRNNSIQVTGELTETDDKKVIYTNREKFDYLAEKNPALKELKDRLGLDTDF